MQYERVLAQVSGWVEGLWLMPELERSIAPNVMLYAVVPDPSPAG